MLSFVYMLADLWQSIINVFDSHPIQIGEYRVSIIWLIFAFLVVGFVVSYYWKGART